MQDRLNTIENQLKTDLGALKAITDEFNLIDDYLRLSSDGTIHGSFALPAIVFEAISPQNPINRGMQREEISCMMAVIVEDGNMKMARSKIKRLLSLVTDFLISDDWTYCNETVIGNRGFDVGPFDDKKFRAVAGLEFVVLAPLNK